ncbi:MAG: hypothetical protein J5I93_26955 [Pirellulaceae bacterium]|nr:hypothetical protein [Pirellulaceae bacterium]
MRDDCTDKQQSIKSNQRCQESLCGILPMIRMASICGDLQMACGYEVTEPLLNTVGKPTSISTLQRLIQMDERALDSVKSLPMK